MSDYGICRDRVWWWPWPIKREYVCYFKWPSIQESPVWTSDVTRALRVTLANAKELRRRYGYAVAELPPDVDELVERTTADPEFAAFDRKLLAVKGGKS